MEDEREQLPDASLDGVDVTPRPRTDWPDALAASLQACPEALRPSLRMALRADRPLLVAGGADFSSFYNDAFAELCGARDAAQLGRPLSGLWPHGWGKLHSAFERALAGAPQWLDDLDLSDGHAGAADARRVDCALTPILDPGGQVVGILLSANENTVTRERRRERRTLERPEPPPELTDGRHAGPDLAAREQQLRLATEAAEIGLWDLDLVTDTLYWPPRVKAMFGISPEEPVSIADFFAGLHPDDRDATAAWFAAACDPAQRVLYDVEYRTIGRADGVVRHVAAKGRGIFDASGRCVRVIGTAIDISVRKAQDAALRHSERELRESARRKDQFIATLAHELRNPLAAVSAALELQVRRGETTKYTAIMKRQTGHLVRLVDDLMEVSRITSGSFELRRAPVSLDDAVEHAVEASSPLIKERQHRLTVHRLAAGLTAIGDLVRLAQIVGNLLSNAARFTPPGGSIVLTLDGTADECLLSVADTGAGFSAERAGQMFEMFARGPESPGLGVGLALSRQLADMHGGTLEAESPGPGRGSTFRLRLPRAAGGLPPTLAATSPDDGCNPPFAVLVVDDNRDAADTVAELLQLAGARVRIAYDGASALIACEDALPQLLVLDIGMPGMNGYEVAARVRAMPGGDQTVIAGLSGWGSAEDVRLGKEAGFDHHLVKPPAPEELAKLMAAMKQAQR